MSGARAYEDDDDGEVMVPVESSTTMSDAVSRETSTLAPQPANNDGRGEPTFNVIETDDNFQPLGREAALTEDGAGDGTYLDTQRRAEEARQREPRASRRQRAKNARDTNIAENLLLRRELQELRARLDGVEPRVSDNERARFEERIAHFDRQIGDQAARVEQATRALADAMRDQDADAFTAALNQRDTALAEKARLETQQYGLKAAAQRFDDGGAPTPARGTAPGQPPAPGAPPARNAAPAEPPPAVKAQVEDFLDAHPWAASATGAELAAIQRLDKAVAMMGIDPASDRYWDTLEQVMSQDDALKHHFRGDAADAQPLKRPAAPAAPRRAGPPMAGPADRAPPPNARGGTNVYLSPGRKDAMIRMGVLSNDGRQVLDSNRFNRLLKQYAAHDQQNPPAAAGGSR